MPSYTVRLESLFAQLDVEDNGQCSSCGMVFSREDDEDRFWVCCDKCNKWYCFACHKLLTKDSVPDEFYCLKCTQKLVELFLYTCANASCIKMLYVSYTLYLMHCPICFQIGKVYLCTRAAEPRGLGGL